MDRQALSRATDSSDAPTPGYLYVDLSRIVSSNPNAAKDTASYLLTRLRHKNHNVKYKALRLIHKLAAVHPPYFQRSVTVDPEFIKEIKEHLHYRGPPDPLRGDEIYSRVRNEAQECLDALYREHEKPESVIPSAGAATSGSSYAMGSVSSSSMPQYGNSSGRMQGFGSHPDPRLEVQESGLSLQKVTKLATEIGDAVVGMIKDPLAKNVAPMQSPSRIGSYNPSGAQNAAYNGPVGGSGTGGLSGGGISARYGNQNSSSGGWGSAAPPGRSQLAASTGGQWTMASNRGPNAVRPPATMGSWGNAPAVPVSSSQVVATGVPTEPAVVNTESKVKSDGSYERYLIGELCPASGLYAAPDDSKIAQFKGLVGGLEVDLVCPPLLDLLENDMWQVKGKALHVIHLLVTLDGELGESYKAFFFECRNEIEPLGHHAKLAVRDPASKVLKLLGLSAASKPKSTSKVVSQEVNLLDFDSPDKAPRPAVVEEDDLINGTSVDTLVVSKGEDGLFGGLTQKQSASESEVKPTDAALDVFADMSLIDAGVTSATDNTAKPTTSSFGFMNSSKPPVNATSAPVEEAPAPAALPPVAPKSPESPFDSLLSLSAPTPISAYQQPMSSPIPSYLQMNPQMINAMSMPAPIQQRQVMLQGGAGHYFHLDVPQPKKDDKSFDFVKDVVKSAK